MKMVAFLTFTFKNPTHWVIWGGRGRTLLFNKESVTFALQCHRAIGKKRSWNCLNSAWSLPGLSGKLWKKWSPESSEWGWTDRDWRGFKTRHV